MPAKTYAPMPGFNHVDTDDDSVLEQWRTGRAAANPGEAQALVRALDKARAAVDRDPWEIDSKGEG